MKRIAMTCALAVSLCGCYSVSNEDQDSTSPVVQKESKFDEMNERERLVWTTLVAACPGLSKYQDDWTPSRTTLADAPNPNLAEFVLADRLQQVPSEYLASGHRCFANVGGERADRVTVTKRPCVKVCLDVNENVPTSTEIEIQ